MKRLIFALATTVLFAGCTTNTGIEKAAASGKALPHHVTAGQAQLASKLYPKLVEAAESNDNLFISPLSLSEGLGLAMLGARGQTETELRALMGWDAATRPELLIADYDRFLTKTGDKQVALSVANALWLSQDLAFARSYLDATRTSFRATAERLDFSGNPGGSADRINGWVAAETRERITKIVDPSGFDDSTAAVLTNAVWFKADWTAAFEDGSASA